ncbi:MAG: Vms1/Ankzf1 family peptidyl-tRNA hydrolase [Candidatus Thermoplasmatota archaeon]|nr:Vms1/Ankzf1 family peptidyl-tRNA hydrolase [Candidatus Thermoplasmatota archaeon]
MKPSMEFTKVMPRGLVPVTDIDVRELAEIYDETDTYLSIYLPTASRDQESMNETYMNSRTRAVKKALVGKVASDLKMTFDLVGEHISHKPIPGEKGRIIFASAPVNFLHVYRIGVEPERKLVLDTSPFLLPLARLRDDYEDYALLLMDSQQAKLFTVRSNVMNVEDSNSIDLMNRHKKGGMSQMRFNRLRRGAISAFISEVIEDIEELEGLEETRGIVLAGPGEAKKQLHESLPQHLREQVIGIEDISMDTPLGNLLDLGERVAEKDERGKEQALVEELRSSIMKGEPAAYGAQKVRTALKNGRVSVLLLLDKTSIPGWICERCQSITERTVKPKRCPNCGGPTSVVDVVEEIYELAERTGARTEFVKDAPFLESIGGIGAVLRY